MNPLIKYITERDEEFREKFARIGEINRGQFVITDITGSKIEAHTENGIVTEVGGLNSIKDFHSQTIKGLISKIIEEVERKIHSSRPIPTEIESDTAKCVKEIHKILAQTVISPNPYDNMTMTASMYVNRYEDEQRAKYVRYLENKVASDLEDINNSLKELI